ncbi:EthD family reductase [Ureibacillus manganicus]|uniref:EthD domain-containing protein n=1 Tax=Ureibacillus manganicus DSM 26584 TaxID=1384049 RepID=A0A0A3I2H7_9BACL|nr:EthD family reductase [Ureibacillus manganicus]KGR79031.1 hypothetical protein CD29_08450 [Ureibacillus manganicus DSM 26584]
MAKLMVMYERPTNIDDFEKYYQEVHLPMVQEVPNLKNACINRVIQTQNSSEPIYLIAELEFENMEVLQNALSSTGGQKLQNDVVNLVKLLPKPPIVCITE